MATATAMDCRQVQLALLLAEAGARFAIVGGTARFLRGENRSPADLDVVVTHITGIRTALERHVARGAARVAGSPVRFVTSWTPVDVFVGALPSSRPVEVDGVALQVADG